MSDQVKSEAKHIVEKLSAAGWQRTQQGETFGTASLVYDNGRMALEAEQEIDASELIVTLIAAEGDEQQLFLVYGDRLDEVLTALIAMQDVVSRENFRDHIRTLVATCPEVYVQAAEDAEPELLLPE